MTSSTDLNALADELSQEIINQDASFWDRVIQVGECWELNGYRYRNGYARASNAIPLAHRHSYTLAFGLIPNGMHVCHRCDNPPCIRPSHLFLGTRSDNMKDMHAKGRYRGGNKQSGVCLGCKRDLPLTSFHKELRVKSGRASRCIECINGTRGNHD